MTNGPIALDLGRQALARFDWPQALDLLRQAEASMDLSPEDLEGLADAAYWTCRFDECIAVRERACAGYEHAGQRDRAAYMALLLFFHNMEVGRPAVGNGWFGEAKRLLEDQPECAEAGHVMLTEAQIALMEGELDRAIELSERVEDLARRLDDRDLRALAIHTTGRARIKAGKTAEGMALLDEAMLSALRGRLHPFSAGQIYCNLIGACMELGDYGRAAQWTDQANRWADRLPFGVFPGMCRVHRVQVLSLRGLWPAAEEEVRRLTTQLLEANLVLIAGESCYQLADIRRQLGDLAGAEDGYRRAAELGCPPQPGLALLRLAQGRVDAAKAAIERSLTEAMPDQLQRAKLLPAWVQIAIAAGDLDAASGAVAELEAVSTRFATAGLSAMAAAARGRLRLAEGEYRDACRSLRSALSAWQSLDVPFEVATVGVLLGMACREAGDEDGAIDCLEAASATFARLGVAKDAARASQVRDRGAARLAGMLTQRETAVLRQVARGSSNKAIATSLHLSEKTVERHLSNIFVKLGVTSRTAAAAYAFQHGIVGGEQVEG